MSFSFRLPLLLVALTVVVAPAQDAPAPAAPATAAAQPAPKEDHGGLTEEQNKRLNALADSTKSKLRRLFERNSGSLAVMTEEQRHAFFETEVKKLVEADAQEDHSQHRTVPRRNGPTEEQRRRFDALSDAAKEKVRALFRDNRERLTSMTEEERRAFIESQFKTISEADEASRKGK